MDIQDKSGIIGWEEVTRGPLFAAGEDKRGTRDPEARAVRGLGAWVAVRCRPRSSSCDGSVSRRSWKCLYWGSGGTEPAVRSVGTPSKSLCSGQNAVV